MLDSESSLRLNSLRFPLIVGVVFLHAYSSTEVFAGKAIGVGSPDFLCDFVRNFISQGIARIAVPLFFLMSGYLFFSGFEWSKERYFLKLQTRTKSLLVPFIFWNVVVLTINAFAQAMPATQIYFSGKNIPIASYNGLDYLNALIGFRTGFPIAYQFWFIRDLMILVLLVPLINLSLKVLPLPFLSIFILCWFLDVWPLSVLSAMFTLFFCVGAYLALKHKSLFALDKYGSALVLPYLIIVVALNSFFIGQPFSPYLEKIGIIFGALVALFMTKFLVINESMKSFVLWLSSSSFFLYAMHEPLLTILKRFLYKAIVPDSSALILFLYFIIPIMVIVISVVAYRVLVGVAPRFTKVVTGGR